MRLPTTIRVVGLRLPFPQFFGERPQLGANRFRLSGVLGDISPTAWRARRALEFSMQYTDIDW